MVLLNRKRIIVEKVFDLGEKMILYTLLTIDS
jgi:hypothetical protein